MNDVPVRMRVLWGAVLVTAGARMTEPRTVDIPLFVEGDQRPEHMPVTLMSGTVDELVTQFRGLVSQAFAQGLEVQRKDQVAFIDTSVIGFTDLTPGESLGCSPPAPLPPPSQPMEPTEVPDSMPAEDVPPANTELTESKSQATMEPPAFPPMEPPAQPVA